MNINFNEYKMSYVGKSCCVESCFLYQGKPLVRFPSPKKNMEIFTLWLQALNSPRLLEMPPQKVYNSYRICVRHFEEKWIVPGSVRRIIRNGAIPTIFFSKEKEFCMRSKSSAQGPEILKSPFETEEKEVCIGVTSSTQGPEILKSPFETENIQDIFEKKEVCDGVTSSTEGPEILKSPFETENIQATFEKKEVCIGVTSSTQESDISKSSCEMKTSSIQESAISKSSCEMKSIKSPESTPSTSSLPLKSCSELSISACSFPPRPRDSKTKVYTRAKSSIQKPEVSKPSFGAENIQSSESMLSTSGLSALPESSAFPLSSISRSRDRKQDILKQLGVRNVRDLSPNARFLYERMKIIERKYVAKRKTVKRLVVLLRRLQESVIRKLLAVPRKLVSFSKSQKYRHRVM